MKTLPVLLLAGILLPLFAQAREVRIECDAWSIYQNSEMTKVRNTGRLETRVIYDLSRQTGSISRPDETVKTLQKLRKSPRDQSIRAEYVEFQDTYPEKTLIAIFKDEDGKILIDEKFNTGMIARYSQCKELD